MACALTTLAALFLTPALARADQQVASGSYVGDGWFSRHIGSAGFRPSVVLIKSDDNYGPVIRTDTMPFLKSKPLGPTAALGYSMITSFTSTGFWISSSDRVNRSGVTYHWIALRGDAATLAIGSYQGDGNDNRSIGSFAFDPEVVLVIPAESSEASLRVTAMPDNRSCRLDKDLESDRIQRMLSGAFQIGRDNDVNKNNDDYYYIAWADDASDVASGTYVGNATDNRILPLGQTGSGFVVVKPDDNSAAVFRGTSSPADQSFAIRDTPGFANAIQSLTDDHAVLGTDDSVNKNNEDYYWFALRSTAVSNADLVAGLSADPATIAEGDSLYVRALLRNQGGILATVTASLDVPAGLTYRRSIGSLGSLSPVTGQWGPLDLDPGEEALATLVYTADSGSGGAHLTLDLTIDSSSETDPDATNNSATAEIDILAPPEAADIKVGTAALTSVIEEGDTVAFEVTVENLGPGPVNTLRLDAPLPAGTSLVTATPEGGTYLGGVWNVGPLAAGDERNLSLLVRALEGTAGTTLTHTVSVLESDVPDPNGANDLATAQVSVVGADLVVGHEVSPSTARPGDVVTFTTTLTNAGPSTAAPIEVQLAYPAAVTYQSAVASAGTYVDATRRWTLVSMAPLASATLTWTGVVAAGSTGSFTSTASIALASPGDPNPGNESDSAVLTMQAADLAIDHTANALTADADTPFSFGLTVTNTGPSAAQGVRALVQLPAGVVSIAAVPGFVMAPSTNIGTWTLGTLAAGETRALALTLRASATLAGSDVLLRSSVASDSPVDPVASNDEDTTTLHVRGADLAVTMSVSDHVVIPGNPVQFTIRLANLGPDAANTIVVRDLLPSGLDFEAWEATSGTYNSGTGHWSVASLGSGSSAELILTAIVNTTGTVVNQAQRLSSQPIDPVSSNDQDSEEVGTVVAELALVVATTPAIFYEGNVGTLTVTATNEGPNDATNVVIEEFLPDDLGFAGASATAGTYDSATSLWSIPSLPTGMSATLSVQVTAPLGSSGPQVHSAALVSSDQVDTDGSNDTASVEFQVVAEADMVVDLSVDSATVREGERVTLQVIAGNEGPSPATGGKLQVSYGTGLAWVSHEATQGTFDPILGTWTLDPLDAGASAAISLDLEALPGSAGSTVPLSAALAALTQPDPDPSNDSDETSVDIAGTLSVSVSQNPAVLHPGESPQTLLALAIENVSGFSETLQGLQILLRATGSSSDPDDLERNWEPLELWYDGASIAAAGINLDAATVHFTGLSVDVDNEATTTLEVRGSASWTAHDGDTLDLYLASPEALTFARAVPLEASGSLDPGGAFTIDGLVAGQVTVHAPADGMLVVGGSTALVADLTIPANGYETDQLDQLLVATSGSIEPGDLLPLRAWIDGGDGTYQADTAGSDDTLLGEAPWTDTLASFGGLSLDTPLDGSRLFIDATAAGSAAAGGRVSFTVPLGGITMASDNDGPLDQPVAISGEFVLVDSGLPVVRIEGIPRDIPELLPGEPTLRMLRLRVTNQGPGPVTVRSLLVTDGSEIFGTREEADASWAPFELVASTPVATGTPETIPDRSRAGSALTGASRSMSDGTVQFDDLGLLVPAGLFIDLSIYAAASTAARDGDALQLAVVGPGSLEFEEAVTLEATWPVSSSDLAPVNGMSAAQIEVEPLSSRWVPAGTADVLVAGFRLPANGYAADVLQDLSLVNAGSATDADIRALHLRADDATIGSATFAAGRWTWSVLALPVSAGGRALTVHADIDSAATPGRTIRLSLPSEPDPGVIMESANDGPRDHAVEQTAIIEIAPPEGALSVSVDGELGRTLLPGEAPTEMLRVHVTNATAHNEVLEDLTFDLRSSGLGSDDQIAAGWGPLEIWLESSIATISDLWPSGALSTADASASFTPVRIASANADEDQVGFVDLALALESGTACELSLRGSATLLARDGDRLDPKLLLDGIRFAGDASFTAVGSLDPPGRITVDGMSAAQITVFPATEATFEAGSRRNLTLDFIAPSNGYAADQLQRIALFVRGTIEPGDLDAIELWVDDGDGVFDTERDTYAGELRPTGDRWELTGLAIALPPGGRRLFVSTSISFAAPEGRSLELWLPSGDDVALGVASGNDGPLDREVGDGEQHIISSVDRVSISARPIASGTVYPGQTKVPLLHLYGTNSYAYEHVLEDLTIRSASTGVGTTADLDRAFEALFLYEDLDANGVLDTDRDLLVGVGAFENRRATFPNLDWVLPAGGSSSLFLAGRVSGVWAHDGDELSVEVADPLDLGFAGDATAITGSWPLASGARWIVDGMVARQIATASGGTRAIGPGQGPVLAFDVVLPTNGYVADRLHHLEIENAGSAREEIARLELFRDDGDGEFEPDAGDVALGQFASQGTRWVLDALDEVLDTQGNRFFVGLTASSELSDSVTVQLRIPKNGVQVDSNNDGPYDIAVQSSITLVLGDVPLAGELKTWPRTTNVDQAFEAFFEVTNLSDDTVESIQIDQLQTRGDGAVAVVSGPTPSSVQLAPGERSTFRWQLVGTLAGSVEFLATARGRSRSDGSVARSFQAISAPHDLRTGAETLRLFALGSLPSTLSYGQSGVVPLSFTFRNPGGAAGSDIELKGLRVRIEDENGQPVVPGGLIERVIVNEGSRIYHSTTKLPLDGDVLDLVLDTPALVTTTEPTTLNLRFDLKAQSPYQSYRVIIDEAASFTAIDATNELSVDIELFDGTFPVRSGLARLVGDVSAIRVNVLQVEAPIRVGPATHNVEVLSFEAVAGGAAQSNSDARIGSFAITVRGPDGHPLPALGSWLERVTVRTPLQTILNSTVSSTVTGDSLFLRLASPLALPANVAVPVSVEVDLRPETPPATLQFELEDANAVDARDANTGNAVPVVYESGTRGPLVRIETPVRELWVSSTPRFPDQTSIGARGVTALDVHFVHSGDPAMGRARLGSLAFQLWNGDRQGIVPADLLSRIHLYRDGELVAETASLPQSGSQVTVALPDIALEPGDSTSLEVRVDILAAAPLGELELTAGAPQIAATDANSGAILQIRPAPGTDLPIFSGRTRITSPARVVLVEFLSHLPAALVRDERPVWVGELVLSHTATDGSGPVTFDSFGLRAIDASLSELAIGTEIAEVTLFTGDSLWASARPIESDQRIELSGLPLHLSPGQDLRLRVWATFRRDGHAPNLHLGMDREDIGIQQPEGALFEIEPRPKAGLEFPLWSELGNFGALDLEESYANFPNPFAAGRESTTFVYYLRSPAQVDLRIWTLRGEEVITLLAGRDTLAGLHQDTHWDGRNGNGKTVRNGVYLAELEVRIDGRVERILRKVAVVR